MRNWLLVAAAAVAIGLGIWLTQDRPDPPEETSDGAASERPPQLIIDELHRITTDASGAWQSTLVAESGTYFEQDDRLELQQPHLWGRGDDDFEMQAIQATLRDGTQWVLQDEVLIRSLPEDSPPGSVRTHYLEYDTITEIAETFAPVTVVQQDRLTTTAIGMTLNLSTQEFELHEQVRSLFIPEQ